MLTSFEPDIISLAGPFQAVNLTINLNAVIGHISIFVLLFYISNFEIKLYNS
jgi:hypothetical protein